MAVIFTGCGDPIIGGPGGPPTCAEGSGESLCGEVCVDLSVSDENCGACGASCAGDDVCIAGSCGLPCVGGAVQCGDECAELATDRNHCGACDSVCAEGEVCSEAACGLSCGGSTPIRCGDACVDTDNNPDHCGGCDVACAEGEVCSGGACGLSCGGATPTLCTDACVDTDTDRANCGACGVVCAAGEVCSDGACGLSCGGDTPTTCGLSCVDTDTNRNHCGACDALCAGGEVCSGGACGLSCGGDSPTQCGTRCVDTDTDRAHCGGCDVACGAGEICQGGACGLACGGATPTLCGSSCVDGDTNRNHCGGCDIACAAGEVCASGTCGLSCGGTTPTQCGTSCTNTDTDDDNCGACGAACPSGQSCSAGACGISCGGATPDICGAGCVDTQSNRDHCGACDVVCAAGEVCSSGTCGATCGAGLLDCSGSCVDPATDPSNCGSCGTTCGSAPDSAGVCIASTCEYFCSPFFGDCNMDLGTAGSNGCETPLIGDTANCGACGSACGAGDVCMGGGCVRTTLTTEDSDFSGGDAAGSGYDMSVGGLTLDASATINDFLWIPNTAESSMSKWDPATGLEVARYRVGLTSGECVGACCWDSGCNMPSRVVVDGHGDAYVANRGFGMQGTVTKIAANIDDCVDRNGNGMIDTSTSATAMAFDADECVLWTAPVGASNAVLRALAIDAGDTTHPEGYPWVGSYNLRQFWKLDPDTGAVIDGPIGVSLNPYGAIVLSDGTLYANGLGTSQLAVIDTTVAAPTATTISLPQPAGVPLWRHYGMTADANGRLWFSYGTGVQGYDPATGQSTGTVAVGPGAVWWRGITVDGSGRVWAAIDSSPLALAYWNADAFVAGGLIDPAEVTIVTMPAGFTGASAVGADSNDQIWYTNFNSPTALFEVDPATGTTTTHTGPNRVYSYSDFTGGVRRTVIATGTYSEVFDGLCVAPTWEALVYDVSAPAGTEVSFVAETADTVAGLDSATSVLIETTPPGASPGDVLTALMGAGVTPGRYLRLTTILRGEPGNSPVVRSYTIGWSCP